MKNSNTMQYAMSAVIIIVVVAIACFALMGNSSTSSNGVTYDGNGGHMQGDQDSTYVNGTIAVINEFERYGYEFVEWNTSSNGMGTSYSVGDSVPSKTKLYALWVKASYEVESVTYSGISCPSDLKFCFGQSLLVDGMSYNASTSIWISGGSDWKDMGDGVFKGIVNGSDYRITIDVDNYDMIKYTVDSHPTVSFRTGADINISITIEKL